MVCDITMTTQQCKVVSVVFWHITYHCIMVESIGISSILLEVCWLSEALAYIIYHVGHDIVITHQCSIISSLAYIIYHVYYIWYISLYRGSKHQHQLKIVFCQRSVGCQRCGHILYRINLAWYCDHSAYFGLLCIIVSLHHGP